MNSKQIIDYVCEVLNINTSNTLIILDMIEDLKEVKDLAEFKKVLKDRVGNLNDEYKYLSGYQKFAKIVRDFKKQDSNIADDKIVNYCKKLVDKCRHSSCSAYDAKPHGYNFNDFIDTAKFESFKSNSEPVFNEKEIELLESVGGCKRWLKDYDENKFLEDLIESVYKLRKNNTLTIGDKKVFANGKLPNETKLK